MEIADVAKNMNKMVLYRHREELKRLKLTACILRKHNNQFYYTAELMDMNQNAVMIVQLKNVMEDN